MSGDLYDEVLPERATVAGATSYVDISAGEVVEVGRTQRPARAGDTIEVPCPGRADRHWPCDMDEDVHDRCDGSGTLRVMLTEDPHMCLDVIAGDRPQQASLRGWRHVGEVQP